MAAPVVLLAGVVAAGIALGAVSVARERAACPSTPPATWDALLALRSAHLAWVVLLVLYPLLPLRFDAAFLALVALMALHWLAFGGECALNVLESRFYDPVAVLPNAYTRPLFGASTPAVMLGIGAAILCNVALVATRLGLLVPSVAMACIALAAFAALHALRERTRSSGRSRLARFAGACPGPWHG